MAPNDLVTSNGSRNGDRRTKALAGEFAIAAVQSLQTQFIELIRILGEMRFGSNKEYEWRHRRNVEKEAHIPMLTGDFLETFTEIQNFHSKEEILKQFWSCQKQTVKNSRLKKIAIMCCLLPLLPRKMKLKFTKAWISILRLPLPVDIYKEEDGVENEKDDSKAGKEVADPDVPGTVTNVSSRKLGIDHFNNEESNPLKSGAMRSSLWEIDTLRDHYCQPVSRFVSSLENDLTVQSKPLKSMLEILVLVHMQQYLERRLGEGKQVPLAFYKATPAPLFSDADFSGWTFKSDEIKENDEKNISSRPEENGHMSSKRAAYGMRVICNFFQRCL